MCLFIVVANSSRFQGLKRDLDNYCLLDKDTYPITMNHSLKLLDKFKTEVGIIPKGCAYSGDDSGVAFAQAKIFA